MKTSANYLDSLKPLESGDRQKSIANLSRIVTALHRYHADHHHLPAAAINGKDGKGGPPHSWRVELLPYLDEQPLYDSYHFDEPWDSDHNKQLAETMPDVFRCPLDKPDSINTSYFGITSQDKPAGYGDSGESDSDFGGGYEAPQSTASFESSGGLGSGESETDSGGGGLEFGLGVGDDNQTAQVAPVPGTTVFWNHSQDAALEMSPMAPLIRSQSLRQNVTCRGLNLTDIELLTREATSGIWWVVETGLVRWIC